MRQSPCRYCPDRAMGCHAICPKYAEFRTKNDHDRMKRHMDQLVTSTLIEGARRVERTKYARQKNGEAGAWRG